MLELTTAGKIALLVAVPTTFVLLYWLLKTSDDDEDEPHSASRVTTSRQTIIEVKVPRAAVGAVIGRQGANIKEIQEESGARVHFKEENSLATTKEEDRTVVIRGTSETAQHAELLIHKIIADMPDIFTEEIRVPGYCLGRIIGRNGENIRQMSRTSKAKIYIDRTQDAYGRDAPRTVAITGSRQQIDLAKGLIGEKVEEEEVFRAKAAVSAANRDQRNSKRWNEKEEEREGEPPTLQGAIVAQEAAWDESKKAADWPEKKDYLEVYVSAVENPGHFWVQILNSTALQLDRVTEEMTGFYNTDEADSDFKIPEATLGDLVAAPFDQDPSWYRARVVGFDGDRVDLYYVDYGDNCWVPRDQLRRLRPDFLTLSFQATECKLANIKPIGDSWSEEAIEAFEELTYCAHWKVLIARTVRYEAKGVEMVPCLQLYDTNGPQDIDVNEELIKRGFAERVETVTSEALETSDLTPLEVT